VIAAIGDDEILAYVREDNYEPLRQALARVTHFPGWKPDLDFAQGFDADGLARDGSWWRAFRYKPFLGTFWPTNGSTDDVLIRLPPKFWKTADGQDSVEVYKVNLAILEAAMTVPDGVLPADLLRTVGPVSEDAAGLDLDGNGVVGGITTEIRGLPASYIGGAADERVTRHLYPPGSEFLHTVRYIDPDSLALLSARMKEVRYSRKVMRTDTWSLLRAYEKELNKKQEGLLPLFVGDALVGLRNDFGWQYQGWIEDQDGRLRLQSYEEQFFCMGCHSNLGVTADQSFSFPRKVPGAAGWGHQTVAGIPDVPQAGHNEPEILTYFRRVGGGDELRANDEILDRFFPGGSLDEAGARRAAPEGDQDIRWLIVPSRERALALNKAYRALVMEQSFERGRDAVATPAVRVHQSIVNGSTDLAETGQVFPDGRIWLDWSAPYGDPALTEVVQSAYVAYYGRPADPSGLDYWTSRLSAEGGSLDALIDAFAASAEAQERLGGLSPEAKVDRIYEQLFARAPDPEGRAFYLTGLAAGTITPQRIALDVLNGARNQDALIRDNRIAVAGYFTEQVVAYQAQFQRIHIPAAAAVIDAVGASPESLAIARDLTHVVLQGMLAD
jgi:hypothetical protein